MQKAGAEKILTCDFKSYCPIDYPHLFPVEGSKNLDAWGGGARTSHSTPTPIPWVFFLSIHESNENNWFQLVSHFFDVFVRVRISMVAVFYY